MNSNRKITCPCCGYKTLNNAEEWEICDICFWEDDPFQRTNIEETGANKVSLIEGQRNFEQIGACEPEMLKNIRKPDSNDEKGEDWKRYVP